MSELSEPRGPVVLREKPTTELVDRPAYALHEDDGNREAYEAAADWVRFYGGEVKYVDHEGFLVTHAEDEDRYHEWFTAPALITYWPEHNQFTQYGYSMHQNYVADISVPE